jgi:hypothetical protein
MKRVLLVVGIILSLCVAASAQGPSAGIIGKGLKLGFDVSNISTDYKDLNEFLDSRIGVTGGAFLTYGINRQFAVQPEILYVTKGVEKNLILVSAHWSMDYLEVPVLLKFNIVPDGRVQPNLFAGPALDILLSSELGVAGYNFDVKDGMKSTDFGLVFGGGFDCRRITFDLRYTLGLANTIDAKKVNAVTEAEPDDWYYLEGDPSVKNTNFSFMFGVRI